MEIVIFIITVKLLLTLRLISKCPKDHGDKTISIARGSTNGINKASKQKAPSQNKTKQRLHSYQFELLFSLSVMSNAFVTPCTESCQAPLSMGFPSQEFWSGLPFAPPGDLPDPVIETTSPILAGDSLLLNHQGMPCNLNT